VGLGSGTRPQVSVVVPFFGDRAQAGLTFEALAHIQLREGDELMVVDNTEDDVTAQAGASEAVVVISSPAKRSAYAARNLGIECARNDWVLLLDADCLPPASILEDFFSAPVAARCGAVAGEIRAESGRSLAAGYAEARGLLGLENLRRHPHMPAAVTANLLVRRAAWASVGGFCEGMRASGGDIEFSWRIQERGWELCYRPAAIIRHRHRESIGGLLRQAMRNSAGTAWLARVRPGTLRRPGLASGVARSLAGAFFFFLTARPRRASYKLVDGLFVAAENLGWLADNAPRPLAAKSQPSTLVVADTFPAAEQRPVLDALERSRREARAAGVEARRRADNPDWRSARPTPARFWEDDGPLNRARAVSWLILRHPWRAVSDLFDGSRARLPLNALAPAARRIIAAGSPPLVAAPDPASSRLKQRLCRLCGAPDGERI
jgi:GT2 family glycosyltransferase